jgi:hypothetical protein
VLIGTYNVKLSKNELPLWHRSRVREASAVTSADVVESSEDE